MRMHNDFTALLHSDFIPSHSAEKERLTPIKKKKKILSRTQRTERKMSMTMFFISMLPKVSSRKKKKTYYIQVKVWSLKSLHAWPTLFRDTSHKSQLTSNFCLVVSGVEKGGREPRILSLYSDIFLMGTKPLHFKS